MLDGPGLVRLGIAPDAGADTELAAAISAVVATPSANTGAVAAYASAGLTRHPDVADLHREA